MLTCIIIDLRDLRLGNVAAEDTAYPLAVNMYVQHNLSSLVAVHLKKTLQHLDHKIHRGIVIVEQHNPVQRRTLYLRACSLYVWPLRFVLSRLFCHHPHSI